MNQIVELDVWLYIEKYYKSDQQMGFNIRALQRDGFTHLINQDTFTVFHGFNEFSKDKI